MNPDNTVEYNSLSWVKAQLDDVLSDAQNNLNEYIENKTDENLENCIEHLQLIYGTLQMVEVYGASMLAEEMQRTTTALLEGKVDHVEDAYDVLMRAMLQLPDYLEGIQAGKKDAPITLMPLINDLRTVRKEGLLTESALFSPDIENSELPADGYDAAAIVAGKLQGEVKRLRTHYQLGLLDFIRNKKERAGLQRIKAVLHSLEKVSSNAEVRRLWMVISALVEGLMNEGINVNQSIKTLLGTVDRQLKLILDAGEDEFARLYSRELLKNVLYYVGLCSAESKAISEVKAAYKLSDLMHQDSAESATTIGGLNADLFNTVSKGITEDLVQVKDILELFMFSSEQNLEQLAPVAEQLGKIADTYGMLGMGATRQSIMDQRVVLEDIINGKIEIGEQVVLGIASQLLNAESELKDYIAERSGFIDMNRNKDDQIVPASEYREVVFAVVSEGLKNFSEAKEAILSHVSGIGDSEQLDIILNRLEEVRGVAMMLPLGRVESLIAKLQNYVRVALLNHHHKADAAEQDTVADVVTSIEYFFEALSEGRPGVEQGLNAGEVAANILEEITKSYDGTVQEVPAAEVPVPEIQQEADDTLDDFETDSDEIEMIAEEVISEIDKEEALNVTTVKPVASVSEPKPVAQDVEQYAILAEDADEEIVEIFIEEAVEVLSELHNYLPQWKANYNDEEALAVVRRSFHTLKGSGRLLGADLIGEFSWKYENMLNRVIDNKINISDNLWRALDEALAVLPQLIEQLKGNREPIENISQLMASVDALADGRETDFYLAGNEESATEATAAEITGSLTGSVDEVAEDSIVADEIELSAEAEDLDDIEIISFEDVSNDVVIGDSSDFDISELDTEDNAVSEEIVIDENESFNEESLLLDVTDESYESGEIISLGTDEAIEDEFDIELSSAVEIVAESELDEDANSDFLLANDEEFGFDAASDEDLEDTVEEIIDLSDADSEYEIVIDESDDVISVADDSFDIDPMLLKIYYDESQGHLESIRQLIEESEFKNQALKANKDLMRSFHTLYGSARTAEMDAIAELSGAAEKYVKARQDGAEEDIPDDVASVLKEVVQAIRGMLVTVEAGKIPASNKTLHDKLNKIVQQEIQTQLQKSWRDNSAVTSGVDMTGADFQSLDVEAPEIADEISIDISDLAASATDDDEVDYAIEAETAADTVELSTEAVVQEIIDEPVHMSYGDIDDELIDIFLEEADELLENCESTLRQIKETPNSKEHIHQLQRNMHTLKGGARMADLTPVGDLTHNLESLVVMVNENKVSVNKALFDLLQESLDALTTMLMNVKRRQPLTSANNLNNAINMLMRGEVAEKRAVERFDVELSELESDDEEELEDIDISHLLPANRNKTNDEQEVVANQAAVSAETDQEQSEEFQERDQDSEKERPHWGERVTDVNFKESQEQVRVRSDLLNNLVNYAGEVNIYHARMGKQISDFSFNLSELTATVVRLKDQLRNLEIETEIQIRSGYEKESGSFDDNFDPLEMDQYSTLQQLTRSLSETASDVDSINGILSDITRDSETLLVQESRISTDLQEGLMRTRMVRFGGLSSRLRRIVRQVSRELGKEVELEIIGESSEVDRTVLDRIIAPLEHMLRNAVAHGIEKPEVRKVMGKNETGKIIIEVDRKGTNVVINIKDDGSGINADKIRQKAIMQGFISADSNLSDRDALQFILQSGFSTADEVTQVSGRGVGMDVVDSEIKQLGGILDIDTVQGKGSNFRIRLPLTLAINQALLVSTTDDIFAVPLSSIEGVVRITGLELQRFYDSDNSHYEFNGYEYELKHLGGLLSGHQPNYSKQLQLFPVLLVQVGDKRFALHVDDLIGRREIVVKPVGMQIGAVRGIAGATILADGRVVLILEMSALVVAESVFKPYQPVVEEVAPAIVNDKKTIMVVDDSITIRKVTERMLKRYGIDVVLAKDGVDATNQLQDAIPDMMLLDIEMPRMDGFEVASYVRNDERLKNIPIIMITSRTGSKHKEKAMEIGVNEYLGKPFQEEELVSNINKILHTSF
jgi:chemosensory pili system protein ChpA (sensor histidine kinase/response regulator)